MKDGRARVRAYAGREVDSTEAREYLDAPVTPGEREEVMALIRWFRGRYADPVDRLAYVRRAYARWHRTAEGAASDSKTAGSGKQHTEASHRQS